MGRSCCPAAPRVGSCLGAQPGGSLRDCSAQPELESPALPGSPLRLSFPAVQQAPVACTPPGSGYWPPAGLLGQEPALSRAAMHLGLGLPPSTHTLSAQVTEVAAARVRPHCDHGPRGQAGGGGAHQWGSRALHRTHKGSLGVNDLVSSCPDPPPLSEHSPEPGRARVSPGSDPLFH